MSGGVFTISNLGGIGGTSFTPIVNMPEVAILGVSRGAKEPVWKDGSTAPGAAPSTGLGAGGFVPRDMLPLSLSYDHRVIDGADAARFLRYVCEALEAPLTMVL
jgi:pyruvate dehydrogenase E2 component (dihydrolipoamide acetyltransferase)